MADASYGSDLYFTQGSTGLVITSSGLVDGSTSTGSFKFAAGEIKSSDMDTTLKTGHVDLDLFGAKVISSTAGEMFSSVSGGLVSTASTPALDLVSTSDRTPRIKWSSASVVGIQFPPIRPPHDFSTVNGITVSLLIGKQSASGTGITMDTLFYGKLASTESGTVTGAITSTAPTEYNVSIPAAELANASAGGMWNVALVPSTHDQDAIYLYGGYIEYTRVST